MLDSLTKTMSRSGGLVGTLNRDKKAAAAAAAAANSSNNSLGGGGPGSGTLSNGSSLNSSGLRGGGGSSTFQAQVVFLDDSSHVFDLDKKARGAHLLDLVVGYLELREREYFGLIFNDTGGVLPTGHSPDVMRWLDPQKPVRKQMRSAVSSSSSSSGRPTLYFRVKFYVTDPSRLQEEFTRYHLYLQVRRDLVEGRLAAPNSTLCLLTSYALQSANGDYDDEAADNFECVRDLRRMCMVQAGAEAGEGGEDDQQQQEVLPPEEIDRRITELHKLHRNQSPAEAEFNFLEHAKRLGTYGISLHSGKDSSGRDIQLGVTSAGLVVFQNSLKINTFSWSKIVKISFKRKQFFIQLRKELTESYDTLLGFNLASYRSCKNLWKSAVEHHSFFRLHSPKAPQKKFLLMNLGSKFRYSGRTEYQHHQTTTATDGGATSSGGSKVLRSLTRSTPNRKTLPVSLESGKRDGKGRVPRLASPETSSIGSSVHSNGALKPLRPTAPSLSTIQGGVPSAGAAAGAAGASGGGGGGSGSNSTVSLAHRALESFNNKVQSLSTKLPKKAWQEEVTSDDEGEQTNYCDYNCRIACIMPKPLDESESAATCGKIPVEREGV